MATDTEILRDIQGIYLKIDQCYRAKEDIMAQIAKEREDMLGLDTLINLDLVRVAEGKRPRYDDASMKENIERHKNNVVLFYDTIKKEDDNIATFRNMVKVLQEDMARPKEITIDMTDK